MPLRDLPKPLYGRCGLENLSIQRSALRSALRALTFGSLSFLMFIALGSFFGSTPNAPRGEQLVDSQIAPAAGQPGGPVVTQR